MKETINQLKKEIEEVEKVQKIFARQPNVRRGTTDNPNVEDVKKWHKWYKEYEPFRKHELNSDILQAKLQTLQKVCEEIKKELNYYSMPLKDRLKLKVGFDSGEAGHKSVILIKLRNKLQGEE